MFKETIVESELLSSAVVVKLGCALSASFTVQWVRLNTLLKFKMWRRLIERTLPWATLICPF